jgi:hypothetical protein
MVGCAFVAQNYKYLLKNNKKYLKFKKIPSRLFFFMSAVS